MQMKILRFLLLPVILLAGCHFPESNKASEDQEQQAHEKEKTIISITTACILSEITYCPDPEKKIAQYLPDWKIVWKPTAVGGNYAFVASDGDVYAIGIRGSLLEFSEAALNNWLYNDLNVANQKDWSYSGEGSQAKISAGAYTGWQNMTQLSDINTGKKLWDFLNSLPEDASIVLTGHSLGGNLATVYASYLSGQWKLAGHPKMNLNVITFAAPAAGNKEFAESFNRDFPYSLRIENRNDIVPKFPVSDKLNELGSLFTPSPAATEISVGYKNLTVDLSKVFSLMGGAINLLRITNDLSPYIQTNDNGTLITVPLSGKNTSNTAANWFAEAGYQHGMEQYSKAFNAPVIKCDSE